MLAAFYRAVLPEQGYYALFNPHNKTHIWCDSHEELQAKTLTLAKRPDLYFATASFQSPTERTIDNALFRRAFCLDIDAGPAKVAKHGDKVYATQREAIEAVVAWCAQIDLIPRFVVSSGAGLHVYFVLDQDIDVPAWQPLAKAFKSLALSNGMKVDPGPTANAALVLRPPGTLHSGTSSVVTILKELPSVYTVEQFKSRVEAYVQAPKRESSINAEAMNIQAGPPSQCAKLIPKCEALRAVAAVRGDVEEPYWRAMLGLVKFTVEGRAACHALSEGHPDYDYAETERKIDRWTAGPTTCDTFAEYNPQACAQCKYRGTLKSPIKLGWMGDDEARAAGIPTATDVVEAQLAAQATEAFAGEDDVEAVLVRTEPWTEYLPHRFYIKRTANGTVLGRKTRVEKENDDGTKSSIEMDVDFCGTAFWLESWAPGTHDGDQAQITYAVYNSARNAVSRFTLPTKLLASRSDLFGALASQNVQVYPSTDITRHAMEDYVRQAVERIRNAGQRQKVNERFGTMYDSSGQLCVAHGKYIIGADGSIFEGVVSERLKSRSSAYAPPLPDSPTGQWGPDVWASHILPLAKQHTAYLSNFYGSTNFRPYQLAISLAWASPMLAFMRGDFVPGVNLPSQLGLTVSLYSHRSGIGKTAAMSAAALAFGPPARAVVGGDDQNLTAHARQTVIAFSGTLPGFLDEMENVDANHLATFVQSIGNGVTRGRLRRDGGLIEGLPTALIAVMSTNKSHREIIASTRSESNAVQLRLLEINCNGVLQVSPARSAQEATARAELAPCAGAVGSLLHYAMVRLGGEKLNKLGLLYAERARTMLGGQQDERLLWRALGAMLATRAILAQLDPALVVFDEASLVADFKRCVDAGNEFAQEQLMPADGVGLAEMMLTDLAPNTLITVHERQVGDRIIVPLNDRIPTEVLARHVKSDNIVYVRAEALREWAIRRRVSYQRLLMDCKAAGVIPQATTKGNAMKDLLCGTRMSQGIRTRVVPFIVTNMHGIYDDYTRDTADNVVPLRADPEPAKAAIPAPPEITGLR